MEVKVISHEILKILEADVICVTEGTDRSTSDIRGTSSALRGGEKMTTKLMSKTLQAIQTIALKAKGDPNCKFTSLIHLLTEDFLKECFRELKKNKSPGIDGITVSEYEEQLDENIADLIARLKSKKYKPKPVKRVYIPKPNGDKEDSRSDL